MLTTNSKLYSTKVNIKLRLLIVNLLDFFCFHIKHMFHYLTILAMLQIPRGKKLVTKINTVHQKKAQFAVSYKFYSQ